MSLTADTFKDPFDVEEFVERVARSTNGFVESSSARGAGSFDPVPLLENFERSIRKLWDLHALVGEEVNELQEACHTKEEDTVALTSDLDHTMQEAVQGLKDLTTSIGDIASKTVHVGDQLETIHKRRLRAQDAVGLIEHLENFEQETPQPLAPFHNLENLHEAAEIIQKLNYIVTELPPTKFMRARDRICTLFSDVESRLLSKFGEDYTDLPTMKACAHTLYPFKAYAICVEDFIHTVIENEYNPQANNGDVLLAIARTCHTAKDMISKVFRSPQTVLIGFIQEIIRGKLGQYVFRIQQMSTNDPTYVEAMHSVFIKSKAMIEKLSKELDVGLDSYTEDKMIRSTFMDFLETYISLEEQQLQKGFDQILRSHYESIGHYRWMHWKDTMKNPNSKVAPPPEDRTGPDETLLSHDVTLGMFQETRAAIARCVDMAPRADVAEWVYRIFRQLLDGLCRDHILYALNCATERLPKKGAKSEPDSLFLLVTKDANSIIYILQKLFWDVVLPVVRLSLSVYPECVGKKNEALDALEDRLAAGLERILEAAEAYIQHLLAKEQKKTDFRPPDETMAAVLNGPCTTACEAVCRFLRRYVQQILSCLNGKNLELVLRGLGLRFHRILLEHIKSMIFSSLGGIMLTRDLTEYEKLIEQFNDPLVLDLFVTMRELSAITIVKPENIKQLCEEGRLALMDRNTILSFLQLRADYKSAKIEKYFK